MLFVGAADIEHVKEGDEGLYTCTARNKYSHRKQSVYVVVKSMSSTVYGTCSPLCCISLQILFFIFFYLVS